MQYLCTTTAAATAAYKKNKHATHCQSAKDRANSGGVKQTSSAFFSQLLSLLLLLPPSLLSSISYFPFLLCVCRYPFFQHFHFHFKLHLSPRFDLYFWMPQRDLWLIHWSRRRNRLKIRCEDPHQYTHAHGICINQNDRDRIKRSHESLHGLRQVERQLMLPRSMPKGIDKSRGIQPGNNIRCWFTEWQLFS